MGSVNNTNTNIDQSVQIFDNFYKYEDFVPQLEYDAVYSFFASVFGTTEAAANFTVTLFRVAQQSQISVLTLLQQIEGLNGLELNLTLAYYLNNIRSPSTLLGVNVPTAPNYYAARNVKA